MDPLEILKTLVSIPSVNPMGRDLSGPEYYEARVSDWLCDFFSEREIAHERIEVVPGRDNVIARVDGTHLEGLIYRQKLAIVVGKGEGSEPA